MKLLHTADWHIGQLFHQYDRTYEHQQFLNWLVTTIQEQKIDVLLISGDVFDLSNPSAASIKMFYSFLNQAVKVNPDVQIIIIAGNHDSASRLESPKPLLESSNIHIIGIVERKEDGQIEYDKLIVPIKDKTATIKAWCMAVPFLRMGDYPVIVIVKILMRKVLLHYIRKSISMPLLKWKRGNRSFVWVICTHSRRK